MRLPSLYMQALGLRYSTVWANRAGGQSTSRLWIKTSPRVGTASPVNREILLDLLDNISLNSSIQGWAEARSPTGLRGECWASFHSTQPTELKNNQINFAGQNDRCDI